MRVFGSGEAVYHQGDKPNGVYLAVAGYVALEFIDQGGNTVTDRLVSEGGCFGYASHIRQSPHSVTALALTPLRLFHVPGHMLRELPHDTCFLRQGCEAHLAQALIDRRSDLLVGERRNLEARIMWLLRLLPRVPDNGPGVLVRLPFSLTTVARLLNSRPESLSRALRRLERQGACQLEGRRRVRVFHDIDAPADPKLAQQCPGFAQLAATAPSPD